MPVPSLNVITAIILLMHYILATIFHGFLINSKRRNLELIILIKLVKSNYFQLKTDVLLALWLNVFF